MARTKRTRPTDDEPTTSEEVAPEAEVPNQATEEADGDEQPAKRARRNPRRVVTEKPKPAPKAPAPKKPRGRAAAKGKGKAKQESEEPTEDPSEKSPEAEAEVEAGPSTVVEAPPAAAEPKPKKKRAPKKAPAAAAPKPREEKRKADFLNAPPEATMSRLWTLRCERIFLVDRTRNNGELKEAFSVLGATGNVYTVTIDQKPRCNCPDHVFRRNHCKHLIFVFFKVLQVGEESPYWYQKALLNSELEQIFANAPIAPNSMAHPRVLAAHAQATGKAPVEAADKGDVPGNRRIPTEEDDCPVCYEGMHEVDHETLEWCIVCGNALHKECFAQWKRSAEMKGNALTCVWCRADWRVQERLERGNGNVQAVRGRMGYLNLAAAAYGVSCAYCVFFFKFVCYVEW